MKRREFITLLGGAAAAAICWPLPLSAEQTGKVYRVGFLWDSPAVFPEAMAAFRQELRNLGYVEGRTIAFEYRWAQGKPDRMRELAEELVRLKVDVIVAPSSIYTAAAKAATLDIPIIFFSHADPLGSGHVASLGRPGGNITGISLMMTETNVKLLELLKEAVPGLGRVAVIYDPATPSHGPGLHAVEVAARAIGLRLQTLAVRGPAEYDGAFAAMTRESADAVLVLSTPVYTAGAQRLADLAITHKLPSMFGPSEHARAGDLARAVSQAWQILLAANDPSWMFRAAGCPTWVVRDDDGLPMAKPLTEDRLRPVLAQLVDWRKINRNGELIPAHPPMAVIKSILATPDPALPVLTGIVTTPVFGREGELITEPGYHPAARLLYDPPKGFVLPPVPAKPTQSDIAVARSLLLDDLLGDFPFIGEAERAHALALLLVGFVRAMIDGPTPLHLVEKPTQGTGATLMVDVMSVVAIGCRASVMVEGSDDEEWRKRLTAKLRQIPSVVLIDNLRRPLNSSALAAALTAPFWEDRILGVSETTRLPIRCIWIATGNNAVFSGEMARRLVRIRLDARVDQPWRRSGFRHPDLVGWVHANRADLVAACLTLCRAWIAAGMPRGLKNIGSFEAWAAVMGGMLDAIGVPGFLGNIDEMLEASDGEGAVWRVFVGQWWDRFGTAEVGTSDLYELAVNCEPPLPLGTGGDRSQRTRLGKALARMRDRVFDIGGLKARIRAIGVSHQDACFDHWRACRPHRARGAAMRWTPKGYGGERRPPDDVKREGWHEHGILVVSEDDQRLTWPERELIRQLGGKLYGKRSTNKEAYHG